MATTTGNGPGRPSRSGRGRAGAAGSRETSEQSDSFDGELDLLTAALLGLTVGVGVTLLLRRGPGGRRPLVSGLELASRGARVASVAGMTGARVAGKAAARGARRGWDAGMDWAESLPLDDVGDQLRHYLDAAKGAIEDTVSGELQDLRKAIRRRRRRLGV